MIPVQEDNECTILINAFHTHVLFTPAPHTQTDMGSKVIQVDTGQLHQSRHPKPLVLTRLDSQN